MRLRANLLIGGTLLAGVAAIAVTAAVWTPDGPRAVNLRRHHSSRVVVL